MSVPLEAVALLPVVMPVQLMPVPLQLRKKKSPVSNLNNFTDMACFD